MIRNRFIARLSLLARDDRGVAAIEFAIIAPAFIALMIASLQTSVTHFAQQSLEVTAERAARLILTGKAQKMGLNANTFKAEVCKSLPPVLKCKNLIIDVRHVSNFQSASTETPTLVYDSQGKPTNTKFEPGTAGSIVVIKLMYQWMLLGSPIDLGHRADSSGNRIIVATQVSKTEPY